MNDDADDIEIAEAAWRILDQTGGLVDRGDIARRHHLSRQRTYELTNNQSFPKPVGEIGGRPVWLTLHVDRYRAHRGPEGPGADPRRRAPAADEQTLSRDVRARHGDSRRATPPVLRGLR